MNRERLTILRDHLAGLPDERVDMTEFVSRDGLRLPFSNSPQIVAEKTIESCGTAACIAGWACALFRDGDPDQGVERYGYDVLDLRPTQGDALFCPPFFSRGIYSRSDAISAIDSMLANPDDGALPVWPDRTSADLALTLTHEAEGRGE